MKTDKVRFAVVTSASAGIGFQLARQFAGNGFDLLITGEDDAIHERANDLQIEFGGGVDAVQADLSHYHGLKAVCDAIREADRDIDAAVLNAGAGVGGSFEHTGVEDELKMIRLNVESTVLLTKQIVRKMMDQKEGKILFTALLAEASVTPFLSVYNGTKAFVFSFAESLREELKGKGVTVMTLMPDASDSSG